MIGKTIVVLFIFGLISSGILAADKDSEVLPGKPVPTADFRAPEFLPLGVYWAGEFTFNEYSIPKMRWAEVDKALDGLAAHNVNCIWLTHLSAGDTAEFARHAAVRGIAVVASCGELAGEEETVRKGDHKTLISNTLKAWGDAPKPVAWGLGDEPRAGYMNEMAAYVKAWHENAPGEPVATVIMHGDLESAAGAGFDALSADIYPFFSAGNPNSYGMPEWAAWLSNARKLVARTSRPWMMGQSYQEPWGPYEISPEGNIVYLPGGAPHWVMPTPEQMRWQALSTFAAGGKGIFYFLYRWPTQANPSGEACKLPAAAKEKTDSKAPKALVYEDGRTTPQFEAVGQAYAWIKKYSSLLGTLKPSPAPEAWETPPVSVGWNVVNMFKQEKTGKRYLIVVSGYGQPADKAIMITLGPHITGLKSLETGKSLQVSVAAPFRSSSVCLSPATAEIFECMVDTDNMPAFYSDDFSTDKYKNDAMKFQAVNRWPGMMSAENGGTGSDRAFIIYDLEKLLGPISQGGIQMLLYQGGANPPALRGAFWSASVDGESYKAISENKFDEPLIFTERFLKVGFSWTGSSSPGYGNLSRFSILQWKKPATAEQKAAK